MAGSPARGAAARRSPVVRLLYDVDGRLRTRRVLVIIGALVLITALGTVMVSAIGVATDPEVLVAGALIIFIAVKVPLLTLTFWLLTRHQEPPGGSGWSDDERGEILAYLEAQARESVGRPDAVERLTYLTREAWHVADTAPDEHRGSAVSVAVAIAGLRAQAGSRPSKGGERPEHDEAR